jgi:hypothetical protein
MEIKTKLLGLRKLGILYGFCAIALIPWIITLANTLPERYRSQHWRGAWVGFDIFVVVWLLATAISVYRRSLWAIMTATATGVLLIVDAWFDVLTARSGKPALEALLLAIFIEIPLAMLSFWIVGNYIRVHNKSTKESESRVSVK